MPQSESGLKRWKKGSFGLSLEGVREDGGKESHASPRGMRYPADLDLGSNPASITDQSCDLGRACNLCPMITDLQNGSHHS